MIAAASVDANGTFLAQRGFTGAVGHVPGSGVYDLFLTNPPANLDNLVVEVTHRGVQPNTIVSTFFTAPNQITVYEAVSGVADDRNFMLAVYDLT